MAEGEVPAITANHFEGWTEQDFAFFLFFNWFLYEGLAQQRIYSLARSAHGAFFHQESSPFLYWLTVAVAYLAAVMVGATLFLCATLWRANRKRSP